MPIWFIKSLVKYYRKCQTKSHHVIFIGDSLFVLLFAFKQLEKNDVFCYGGYWHFGLYFCICVTLWGQTNMSLDDLIRLSVSLPPWKMTLVYSPRFIIKILLNLAKNNNSQKYYKFNSMCVFLYVTSSRWNGGLIRFVWK